MITLTDTTASVIAGAFLKERTKGGSPAMGMVMTLVVVTDSEHAETAMAAARAAGREHPARVLGIKIGSGQGAGHVDAEVGIGKGRSGETAMISLRGEVVEHAESVVRPLLLPDSPVCVWWAGEAPAVPSADPIGAMAQRRITDAGAGPHSRRDALRQLCEGYAPGDTDLGWSRITPWRGLLAAALDQYPGEVSGASVTGERMSVARDLLAGWLERRLGVASTHQLNSGPGITEVRLETPDGPIRLLREHGAAATLSIPGSMDRPVSLHRRDLPELLAEELRHLDEDDIYAQTVRHLRAGSER